MAKITISPARRSELINKVVSGEMTIEVAAVRYKVPEPFVKKWVEDAGGISTSPTPATPAPAPRPKPAPPTVPSPTTGPQSPAPIPTPATDPAPVPSPAPAADSKGFLSTKLGLGLTAMLVIGAIAGATWFLGHEIPAPPGSKTATSPDPADVQAGEPGPDATDPNGNSESPPGESSDNDTANSVSDEPTDKPGETDAPAPPADEPDASEPSPPVDDGSGASEAPAPADNDPGATDPPAPTDDNPGPNDAPTPDNASPAPDTPPKGDPGAADKGTASPDEGDPKPSEPAKPNVLSVNILNLDTSGDNTKVTASITNHSPLFLSRYYIYLNARGPDGDFLGRHYLTTANLGPGKTAIDDSVIDNVSPESIHRIVITMDKVESIEDGKAVRRGDDFTAVDVNPDRDLAGLIDIAAQPWGQLSKDDGIPVVLVKHLKNFGERYREKQVKMLDVKFLGFTDSYIDALPSVKIDRNGLLVSVNKKEREKWFGIYISDLEGTHFHKIMLPKEDFGDDFLVYKADGSQRLNIVGILVELKDVVGDGLIVADVEAKDNE